MMTAISLQRISKWALSFLSSVHVFGLIFFPLCLYLKAAKEQLKFLLIFTVFTHTVDPNTTNVQYACVSHVGNSMSVRIAVQ